MKKTCEKCLRFHRCWKPGEYKEHTCASMCRQFITNQPGVDKFYIIETRSAAAYKLALAR